MEGSTIIREEVMNEEPDLLVVGLRFDGSERVAATEEQLARGAAWGTRVKDAYAGAAPPSTTKVTICPVPEDSCVESVVRRLSRCGARSSAAWRSCRSRGAAPSAEALSCRLSSLSTTALDGPATITCEAPPVDGSYSTELRYALRKGGDDDTATAASGHLKLANERRLVSSRADDERRRRRVTGAAVQNVITHAVADAISPAEPATGPALYQCTRTATRTAAIY